MDIYFKCSSFGPNCPKPFREDTSKNKTLMLSWTRTLSHLAKNLFVVLRQPKILPTVLERNQQYAALFHLKPLGSLIGPLFVSADKNM